jgi:DNA-binding response OmpR family regulator
MRKHAASIAEARALLLQSSFDAMLLDLRLPDGDSAELVAELRARNVALPPIIVLSADASDASRERMFALGARSFLTKPLDVPRFFLELDQCLA